MEGTTPPKGKASDPAGTETEAHVEQLSTADSADLDNERKRLDTLKAEFALLGYALIELSGGTFLVSKWNLTAHLSDLTGVKAFLRRVGGRHG